MLLSGCAIFGTAPESPRVSLVSIRPLEMTLTEQRYALQLRIMNPNDTALPVRGLDYSVEVNRRPFAYGVSNQAVDIPALGEAVLDVEVVSSLLDLLRQVQGASDGKPGVLEYRIVGRVSLGRAAARLPFEYRGELDWQQKPGGT